MDSIKKHRVFVVTLIANISYFSSGNCVGWTSPVMPKLRDHAADSPFDSGVSSGQEGWIGSLIAVGALCGSVVAGPIAYRVGRKRALLLSAVFSIISFIILITTTQIWHMYLARFLQGISSGLVATNMPMYLAEIATDDMRGAIGSLITLLMIGGILYVYCIGPFVSYVALQYCCLAVPIVFIVSFIFMPESPYYYAVKGQWSEGIKSLQFLRGQSEKLVEDEMARIQETVDTEMSNKGSFLDIFHNRGYRKALLICCGLLMFQQLSGSAAVTFNSQTIFSSAGSTIDPPVASIIMASVQFMSNLLTPFVVDRVGRKTLLMVTSFGLSVSLFALGAFFYVQQFGDASSIIWIPVPALVLYNILYAFGVGPIPWIIMGEIVPSNIKSIVSSVATSTAWTTTFVVIRFYPDFNAFGPFYAFWIFGCICVLGIFFVLFVVVETKGLSFEMIQNKLQGTK